MHSTEQFLLSRRPPPQGCFSHDGHKQIKGNRDFVKFPSCAKQWILTSFSPFPEVPNCCCRVFFSPLENAKSSQKAVMKKYPREVWWRFFFTDFSSNIVSFLPPLSTLQTQSSAYWCKRKNPHWPHVALDHAPIPGPFVFISELTGALKYPARGALKVPSTALMPRVSFQWNCIVWTQDNILPSIHTIMNSFDFQCTVITMNLLDIECHILSPVRHFIVMHGSISLTMPGFFQNPLSTFHTHPLLSPGEQ